MRIGRVVRVVPDRSFGFIQADEFREDVFFHFSVVDREADPRRTNPDMWEEGLEVEFELNEILRIESKLLQAATVRVARRPMTFSLDSNPDRHYKAKHHPRARQRKPTWRGKRADEESTDLSPGDTPTNTGDDNGSLNS